MKALLVPDVNGTYSIELVTETKQERTELLNAWMKDSIRWVTSEELREMTVIKGSIRGRRKTDEED